MNRQWVGVAIFYVRPPFLLSFTNPLMKVSSTVWTLTPSHFPALRHHSIPFTNQFFFSFLPWAHEICRSFFRGFSGSVQHPGCPPAPSVPLTHSFFAKCGGGGSSQGKPHPPVICVVYGCLCLFVCMYSKKMCEPGFLLGDPNVFNNVTTSTNFFRKKRGVFMLEVRFTRRMRLWFG